MKSCLINISAVTVLSNSCSVGVVRYYKECICSVWPALNFLPRSWLFYPNLASWLLYFLFRKILVFFMLTILFIYFCMQNLVQIEIFIKIFAERKTFCLPSKMSLEETYFVHLDIAFPVVSGTAVWNTCKNSRTKSHNVSGVTFRNLLFCFDPQVSIFV